MPADVNTLTLILGKITTNLDPVPPWNGAVHVLCTIIANVITSVTEAEIAVVFKNCQACLAARNVLTKMAHDQPPTPIEVDN